VCGRMIIGNEAKDKLLKGLKMVRDAVAPTLGPKARTVVLQRKPMPPIIVNDGVTIARHVNDLDPEINAGIQLMQSVAARAQENAGDGTTTSVILAYEIAERGFELIKQGADPINIKSELDKDCKFILNQLNELAIPISTKEQIESVATIAANNDDDLGSLIADAFDKIGEYGVVAVENGKGQHCELVVKEGMEIPRGYIHHVFGAAFEKGEVIYENPLVLVSNRHVSRFDELLPALEISIREKRPMVLFLRDITPSALNQLAVNLISNTIVATIVQAPGFGEEQEHLLKDLGTLVGGFTFIEDTTKSIDEVVKLELGSADRVTISKDSTLIVGGHGDKDSIKNRMIGLLNS
jgi:chaperonin GroEL